MGIWVGRQGATPTAVGGGQASKRLRNRPPGQAPGYGWHVFMVQTCTDRRKTGEANSKRVLATNQLCEHIITR